MVKKVKKFNYQKNLKKAWKKQKEKKYPKVKADELKEFWNKNESIAKNYAKLGLSIDPNMTLEIPKAKKLLNPEVMEIEEAKKLNQPQQEVETPAIKKLIKEASRPVEKVYNLNENDVLFCIYMLEKYGESYSKMAKDHKNYYQDTPAQIKKKINLFKNMKYQYQKYLDDKKNGVNFLDKLDDEKF